MQKEEALCILKLQLRKLTTVQQHQTRWSVRQPFLLYVLLGILDASDQILVLVDYSAGFGAALLGGGGGGGLWGFLKILRKFAFPGKRVTEKVRL